MPRISIIVPAHNVESSIAKCIKSIYCNNCLEIEVLVVINNSSDNTQAICDELKADFPNLRIIESLEVGVSSARNLGLKHATGDIIGFCDADDYYEPYAIDAILELMRVSSSNLLITRFYRTEICDNKVIRKVSCIEQSDTIIDPKTAMGLILNQNSIMGSVWNKFYKREILNDIKFDSELTHCEDMHFNMRVLKKSSLRIMLSNIVSYNYVYNPYSATANIGNCFSKEGKLKYITALEKIKSEYSDDLYVKHEVSYAMYVISLTHYSNAITSAQKAYIRKCIFRNMFAVILLYKYGLKRNVKLLLKGVLVLLRIV